MWKIAKKKKLTGFQLVDKFINLLVLESNSDFCHFYNKYTSMPKSKPHSFKGQRFRNICHKTLFFIYNKAVVVANRFSINCIRF